jgi:dTDP-4-amino-4,6-dideoxygalactose transaminase
MPFDELHLDGALIRTPENMTQATMNAAVPFFRLELSDDEMDAVMDVLRSGWLTTGPYTKQFEDEFAAAVGGKHAVAVNSGTAALHLAVAALDLKPHHAVLIPTHTFAATAEVVRYMGATPILVDCDPATLNLDLNDAERKISDLRSGRLPGAISKDIEIVGVIPVHVGGHMLDMDEVAAFARRHNLWVIEDAAHSFPAGYQQSSTGTLRRCGESTSDVTCYSFYPNKSITTGEGGMAITASQELAERIKILSLHGLSRDAWQRYSGGGTWDYQIIAPGYKYNLTDIASALGLHQLRRAESLRLRRERIVMRYYDELGDVSQLQLPLNPSDRLHSWHLFPIRLRLDQLNIDRNAFVNKMRENGVAFSVHWRPLHLHPYYLDTYDWRKEQFPVATREWERLVSLPLFPAMRDDECDRVIQVVKQLCADHGV